MKCSATGEFCLLYVEAMDDKASVFTFISEQKKPVVIVLTGQVRYRVFQRPEDFADLKHMKRLLSVSIIFVITESDHLRQLAFRNGFAAYASMDALSEIVEQGQLSRQRTPTKTSPLSVPGHPGSARRTVPLSPLPPGEIPQNSIVRTGVMNHALAHPVEGPPGRDSSRPYEGLPDLNLNVHHHAPAPTRLAEPEREIPHNRIVRMDEIHHASEPTRHTEPGRDQSRPYDPYTPSSPPRTDAQFYWQQTAPVTPPPQSTTAQHHAFPAQKPAPPLYAPTPSPLPAARRRGLPIMLLVLSLLLLGGAGLGSSLLLFRKLPVTANTANLAGQVVGRIYFLSSEQLSENSSQGIDDEILIDLHNLTNPAPDKSYYAWLLGDKNQGEARSFYLGKLPVTNGNVHFLYAGDQQHTNLLAVASRFLLTEEDATTPPITPSPDYSTWRYYGEFPQSPQPLDLLDAHHYSYLDHIRHLLASDPALDEMELPGGLNNWLFRNTGKLVEWTVSARDRWESNKDVAFIRRQVTYILTYLDGMTFVQQDLPPNTPLPGDNHLAAVGLLNMGDPNQAPPSYLDHIVLHLDGLLEAPGSTPALRQNAAQIITALSNVRSWLETLRNAAKQIVAMTDNQLSQPAAYTLLNDMVDMTNNAYAGQIDPATGAVREGVIWIHDHVQSLATFAVSQYIASNQTPEIIPNNKPTARGRPTTPRPGHPQGMPLP